MAYTPPGHTRQKVYQYVRQRLLAGNPPTVREVQQAFSFRAVQSAREHLEALVADGWLHKEPRLARGYRLPAGFAATGPPGTGATTTPGPIPPAAPQSLRRSADHITCAVPLLGRVQAGSLSSAVEDIEGYIHISSPGGQQELFGLRVKGDSMSAAGILAGDVVIVRRQPRAESGDIVVALVEDEATLKTLIVKDSHIELQPQNPLYPPILPDPEQLIILGKVVEVRRSLEKNLFGMEL